ncbi:RRP15-like protein [Austrofundulus limnaeus]|uniref:Sulfotransferase n=1 Tax=Austrofundulus limnaeus TaxID=52670 RepID=A0A2I4CP83_AUSLI|nr:PREDICTED: RRP15-like protein [Austrofundulus limnaeus]XP_013881792.1 PREDICTED: RRP15-like protein [Austrofundulus limnaeus]
MTLETYGPPLQTGGTTWMQEIVTLISSRGDPHLSQTVPNWTRAPWLEQYYCADFLKASSSRPRVLTTHLPHPLLSPALQASKARLLPPASERIVSRRNCEKRNGYSISLLNYGHICQKHAMTQSGTHMEQHTGGEAGESSHEEDYDEGGSLDDMSDGGGDDDCGDEEKWSAEDVEEEKPGGMAGWAEAMAKILGKEKSKSCDKILVQNKELNKRKEAERKLKLDKKTQVDKKQMREMMFREKPDIVKDRETERALQRIATRGVVQLFNSVRKHQKTTNNMVKEAGGSERKKSKILSSVSKRDFISVLRKAEEGGRGSDQTNKDPAPGPEKPAWSVLREDFMMEASMKDWDQISDNEGPNSRDN